MSRSKMSNGSDAGHLSLEVRPSRAGKRNARFRLLTAAVLLAISPVVVGCTPEEIQQSIGALTISFEQGGVEGGLSTAMFIGEQAALVVGMRLGSLGP
jgi:hypothetical protein